MSYTPQNFQSGDILTAAQLNAMDAGIVEASNHKWQKLGDYIGNSATADISAITPIADELLFSVLHLYGGYEKHRYTIVVPTSELSEDTTVYLDGYSGGTFSVHVTKTSARLAICVVANEDRSTTAQLTIYYR